MTDECSIGSACVVGLVRFKIMQLRHNQGIMIRRNDLSAPLPLPPPPPGAPQVSPKLHRPLAAAEWLLACACCTTCDLLAGRGLRPDLATWAVAFLLVYYLPTAILTRWG